MKNRTLILFAHPRLEKSRINISLLNKVRPLPDVTIHDLYEHYPNFNVDVAHEQQLLLAHDIIVWHHPFYWYSSPPLLKQWIDIVLAFGWAYGPGGKALEGKIVFNAITTGGAADAYRRDGRNRFTLREFLIPFEQTAKLCSMMYLPPFAVQGTHRLTAEEIAAGASLYGRLIESLSSGVLKPEELLSLETLNSVQFPLDKEN